MDDKARGEHGRWAPGQSGNPLGRPRRDRLTSILRDYAQEYPDGEERTRGELLAEQLWNLAMGGDVSTIKYIYDRIDGAPRHTIESAEDGPLEILVSHAVHGI